MSLLGTFRDMPNADYHAHAALGSSGLKLIMQSPLHYWSRYLDPQRAPKDPTPAMKIGTAWHAAIFEPEAFARDYIEVPAGLDRRTKEGKQLWAELEASGKEVMTPDDMLRIKTMAASAAEHPISKVIFAQEGGAAEVSFFCADPETGANLKIRPDYFVPPCKLFPGGLLVDGKTGEDMSPAGFAKYAWNWDLHIQAAFYSDVFQSLHGTDVPPTFVWAAQEKDAPYATAYYSAASDFIDYGRKLYRRALNTYAACAASGVWPGYAQTVQQLELPGWAAKQVADAAAA